MSSSKTSTDSSEISSETMTKTSHSSTQAGVAQARVHALLPRARQWLRDQQIDGNRWDYHAFLGPHFLSQYYLCLKWLAVEETDVDPAVIKKMILQSQRPDGSWDQVEDPSVEAGDLNATIFNYWFLKATGFSESPDGRRVQDLAREFILKNGGIEASSLFTKTFLALFNQFPWARLTRVPYIIFHDSMPSNYQSFAQWVIPHLMPMAYLRAKTVAKDLGPAFSLTELWCKRAPVCKLQPTSANRYADLPLMRKILAFQQPRGSWGGYTVSTLMTVMAIQHFQPSNLIVPHRLDLAFRKGLGFIDGLYVHADSGSYLGCLMDGHYWDTLLAANALVESGEKLENVQGARDYILQTRLASGAFPYGYDFEYAPDVDDTAEAVLLLSNWPDQSQGIKQSADWLLSLQNTDGGWGAFDKNNVGNPLLRVLTRPYRDSVDLFDDSSADSTGHVLDALSVAGYNRDNSPACRRAVAYLRKTQDKALSAWEGRWAINYLFGTACAVVGLIKTGESPTEPYLARALDFLSRAQNPDGGFGESTKSYSLTSHAGAGISTPSQTAWVLWALSYGGRAGESAATRAAEYLCSQFETKRGWHDESVTGTGHPGLLYMVYPSYAAAFPLIALGTYQRKMAESAETEKL
jgi:squalene-hopene/tetraprenyl-beta-curcumene cyclase